MVYTKLVNGSSWMGSWYSSIWMYYSLHISNFTWFRHEKERYVKRVVDGIYAAYISIDSCLCFYTFRWTNQIEKGSAKVIQINKKVKIWNWKGEK